MQAKPKQISEKNTKSEILQAYQELIQQVTQSIEPDSVSLERKQVIDSAAKDTIEKVVQDLTSLRLSVNQTIGNLTEKFTEETEKLSNLQKAIQLADTELEEVQRIKVVSGMLQKLIETHKQKEEELNQEIERKRNQWEQEQRIYEDNLKRQRSREEEEYKYQTSWQKKKDLDLKEAEKEELLKQQQELIELRKKVLGFPHDLEKAVEGAVEKTIAEAGKEAKVRQDFEKQKAESELKIAQLKISSLEDVIRSQNQQIEALKKQLENSLSQLKDIAVAVVDGSKKENADQSRIQQRPA